MDRSDLALVAGIRDTRATLADWNTRPLAVTVPWFAAGLSIAIALLGSVWLIASLSRPDITPVLLPGLTTEAGPGDVLHVLRRNSLVLALHAMACVAGFIAGCSLPLEAQRHSGILRVIHDKAGPLAIAFVVGATSFSLATQAYVLGGAASSLAWQIDMPIGRLLLGLSLHAIPELTALFLPLAAWVIASRRKDWHELLAATFVTVALATPILVLSALVEVYLTPDLILALRG